MALVLSVTVFDNDIAFRISGAVGAITTAIWFVVNQVYQIKEFDKLEEQIKQYGRQTK